VTFSDRRRRSSLSVLAVVAFLLGLLAAPAAAEPSSHGGWTGAWATSMHAPFVGFPDQPNWSIDGFANHSVRQVARVSIGGSAVRIRLSNVYGTKPLRVTGASIGKAGDQGSVQAGTLRPLTFNHSPATVIPVGQEAVSDAALLFTAPLDRLAVTVYFAEPTGPASFHLLSFEPSYRADGDHRFDPSGAAFDETNQSFYYLTGVDVLGRHHGRRHAVVAFGDSITDGAFSTPGADNRYPDELAERLVAAGRPLGVLNAGIGANRLLDDSPCFGLNAVNRFPHDVLNEPRVRTVIVLDSTNDLLSMSLPSSECGAAHPDLTAADLIEGFRDLIDLAHSRGIRIIGATVLPFKDDTYGLWNPAVEQVRDEVNTWMRTSGEFDAVVDFDKVMSNPADPDQLNPAYDGGDRLHPNDAGFRAMAAAIDLNTL
jgi:lysophospholipase L1-like esterase